MTLKKFLEKITFNQKEEEHRDEKGYRQLLKEIKTLQLKHSLRHNFTDITYNLNAA